MSNSLNLFEFIRAAIISVQHTCSSA